ncbi:MAG: glycosyltransferase family 2 protein [Mucilaginibacter sp.]|uniref:glycosyltransferase family 2 protein n=1 Tax=Mucilaginibacter sp. TaxID=1882438 RepID=UPI003265327E
MMKISVLTPSYNSGKYINRAIQSVINQHYLNFEHIIVDGGSTDDTITILKQHDHIIWISEPDSGQSDAMNKAFHISTGDIIVYLNADDEFSPGAFHSIIKSFQEQPDADMVVGNLITIDLKGNSVRTPSIQYADLLTYWNGLHPPNPVSYFYKRRVQLQIGLFPVDDHYSMDIYFLLKAYQKFNLIKINDVLGTFHSDGNNKTAISNVGYNLHNAVKSHLIKQNKLMLPYFYFKLIKDKFNGKQGSGVGVISNNT